MMSRTLGNVVIPSQNEGFYNRRKINALELEVVIPSQNEGFYNDKIEKLFEDEGCYTLSK